MLQDEEAVREANFWFSCWASSPFCCRTEELLCRGPKKLRVESGVGADLTGAARQTRKARMRMRVTAMMYMLSEYA